MKSIKKLLRFILGFLLVSSLSYAQDTESEGEIHELSEFEVSGDAVRGYLAMEAISGATTVGKLVDMPQNITLVTRDMITDLSTQDIRETIAMGASGVNLRGHASLDIQIRGFRSGEGTIDGSRNYMRQQNNTFNIERVEVIKGPAALLYGSTSNPGGHVNFVTKKPRREFGGELKLTVGDADLVEGMVDVTGPVTSNENIQYRVVVGARTKGHNNAPFAFDDALLIAPTFKFQMGERSHLIVRYEYNKSNVMRIRTVHDPVTIKPVLGFINEGLIRVDGFPDENGRDNSTTHFAGATFETRFGDNLAFEANYRYMEFERDRTQTVLTGNDPADEYGIFLNINFENLSSHYYRARLAHTGSLFNDGVKTKSVIGGEYWSRNFTRDTYQTATADRAIITIEDIYNLNYPSFPDPEFNNGRAPDESWDAGLYFQETLSAMEDRLKLTFGVRNNWTHSTTRRLLAGTGTDTLHNPNPSDRTLNPPDAPVDGSHISYRYGAVFKPQEWVSIFGGYTESFNPAGLGRIYDGSPDGAREDPVEAQSYEFGLKLAIGNNVSAVFSYFDTDFTGQTRPDPDNFGFFLQDGLTNNKGVDFSVAYVKEGLSVVAGFYSGDVVNQITGAKPDLSPDQTVNLLAKYDFGHGTGKGLTLGGGLKYRSDMLPSRGPSPVASMAIVDLFAKYRVGERWEFQFNVKNVGDNDHVWRQIRSSIIAIGNPREFAFTTRYRF